MGKTKERPILFNGEMVRAILEGRKTQTRRPIKPQPDMEHSWRILPKYKLNHILLDTSDGMVVRFNHQFTHSRNGLKRVSDYDPTVNSPFGKPGDVLWVRETFADFGELFADSYLPERYEYRATPWERECGDPEDAGTWIPSIHMPKSACRIKLKVKRVWVERIQEMKVADIYAEGFMPMGEDLGATVKAIVGTNKFKETWDSIYDRRPIRDEDGKIIGFDRSMRYDENPWVWCCEFERMEADNG
jgi:hypothetical protein